MTPLIVLALASCTPKSESEATKLRLANLHDEAQKLRLESASTKAESSMTKEKLDESQKENVTLREENISLKEKLDSLQKDFESFKKQRRTGMIGTKYPLVAMANGKRLQDVEIKEVNASYIAFSHSGGLSRIHFRDLSEDLRWQACWNETESQVFDREKDAQSAVNRTLAQASMSAELEIVAANQNQIEARQAQALNDLVANLESGLSSQRMALNKKYNFLREKYPAVFGYRDPFARRSSTKSQAENDGVDHWNDQEPENSLLLNDFKYKRAGTGMSELEALRDAINLIKSRLATARAQSVPRR